jgi:hypothetical protein
MAPFKVVKIEVVDVDRYHREVGRIYLGGRFINREMVRDGFAWRYMRNDEAGEFTDAERRPRETPRLVGGSETRSRPGNTDASIDERRRLGRESAIPEGTSAP